MRKKNERIFVCAAFAVLTVIGFLLRRRQLAVGFDADGLPLPGAGLVLGVLSAVVAVIAALYCRRLTDRASCGEAFRFSVPTALVSFAGAGLLLAGCLADLSASGLEKTAAVLGIVSALVIVAQQGVLRKNKTMHPMIGMIPIVFYIVRLIGDFKQWSTDPIILDYWVKLFAMLAILLAAYYCGGFALDKGKRSATVFFCLLAVFFSALSLADGEAGFSLIVGGSMLWEGACAWQLLRPDEDPEEAQTPEE